MKGPPPPPPPPTAKNKRYRKRNRATAAGTGKAVVDLAGVGRAQAALASVFHMFMEDPDVTLHDIWRLGKLRAGDPDSPMISECVNLEVIYRASADQKWKERKRTFWLGVQNRILAQTQGKIVERELQELAGLEAVAGRLQQVLLGDKDAGITAVAPKSMEGAVSALVQLDKRMSDKRTGVAQALSLAAIARGADLGTTDTGSGAGRPIPKVEDGFDDQEIAAMARSLAERRALGDNAVEQPGGQDETKPGGNPSAV